MRREDTTKYKSSYSHTHTCSHTENNMRWKTLARHDTTAVERRIDTPFISSCLPICPSPLSVSPSVRPLCLSPHLSSPSVCLPICPAPLSVSPICRPLLSVSPSVRPSVCLPYLSDPLFVSPSPTPLSVSIPVPPFVLLPFYLFVSLSVGLLVWLSRLVFSLRFYLPPCLSPCLSVSPSFCLPLSLCLLPLPPSPQSFSRDCKQVMNYHFSL